MKKVLFLSLFLFGFAGLNAGIEENLALLKAVRNGNLRGARKALQDGANVNTVQRDHKVIILECPHTKERIDCCGMRPLEISIILHDLEILELLLDQKEIKVGFKNTRGETPLILAAKSFSFEMINLIISKTMKKLEKKHGIKKAKEIIASFINKRDKCKMSAIDHLLSVYCYTPPFQDLFSHSQYLRLKSIHFLLLNGAEIKMDSGQSFFDCFLKPSFYLEKEHSYEGMSPLTRKLRLELTSLLLDGGINPDETTFENDFSLFRIAALNDDLPLAKITFKNWIDINCVTKGNYSFPAGCTPLHVAASCGNTKFIEFFINLGPKLKVFDSYGQTPLTYAVKSCKWENASLIFDETYKKILKINNEKVSVARKIFKKYLNKEFSTSSGKCSYTAFSCLLKKINLDKPEFTKTINYSFCELLRAFREHGYNFEDSTIISSNAKKLISFMMADFNEKLVGDKFTCSICLENPVRCNAVLTPCRHIFCTSCIEKWITEKNTYKTEYYDEETGQIITENHEGKGHNKCPVCRKAISLDTLIK